MHTRPISPVLVASLLLLRAAADEPAAIPVGILAPGVDKPAAEVALPLALPGQVEVRLTPGAATWNQASGIAFDVVWPAEGGTNAQVMVFLKDWDYFWYQAELPGYLKPGQTNAMWVDLASQSATWQPRGHHGALHHRILWKPEVLGIRIMGSAPGRGTMRITNARAPRADSGTPPAIRNVLTDTRTVPAFGKFEITFDLPDRYVDPFNPDVVRAWAVFTGPDNGTTTVEAFYTQRYYRDTNQAEDRMLPEGAPFWCVRFTPTAPGSYSYRLHARDAAGEAAWGPGALTVTPSDHPGFVRVDKRDPRYFSFDSGALFFPIGHNIRSPEDTRMDGAFPWQQRPRETSLAYARYFRDMAAHGENLAEVWSASWSLGLEWLSTWFGYHGVGQYNLMHAWEMDRVLESAAQHGIRLNYVIHNHGKFSTFSDPEWKDNPFNVENGGYLRAPDDYFTDPRALASFRQLMRYMIARWGYSPNVFTWELWSELDLTGSRREGYSNYRRPEVAEWHRVMGLALKELDPNDHLVSTHVCGDYTHQTEALMTLPQLDWCAVDAYYGGNEPLQIVRLIRATAAHNNPLGKPVLVTEFGGSSGAQDLQHLDQCLHAGLWTSACTPVAGTPLFWWWQLIEEQDFYPKYAALQRFLDGEDRRGPAFDAYVPVLLGGSTNMGELAAVALRDPTRAQGWIYAADHFADLDPEAAPGISNIVMRLDGMENARFTATFWDTLAGTPVSRVAAQAEDGTLHIPVPAFSRDIAFKLRKP